MIITIHCLTVLDIVQRNYADHVLEHQRQMDGWKEKMEEYNVLMREWANNSGIDERPREPAKPRDFKEDYERIIRMLTLHVKEDIDLHDDDFDKLILNKFYWNSTFHGNSLLYSGFKE